jgi:hypothetical protein
MRRSLALVSLWFALPAAGEVDPNLVGMWKLQWMTGEIHWQVRADGVYRLIGVGARPHEHWGRMQASNGRWSSEWERGIDGGVYELRGANWVVTGAHGTGTWQRVWPGSAASPATCPHIDAASVERLFGSTLEVRMVGDRCDFSAARVGAYDEMSITAETVTPMSDGLRLKRSDCENGTNKDRDVRCVAGLGDAALFLRQTLHFYKGNRLISLTIEMKPEDVPELHDADSIALARNALSRF